MIEVTGDLFDHEVIGHGVNCQGLMGAGVAVGFKQRFPKMYHAYVAQCSRGILRPGGCQPWYEHGTLGFNIASQDQPGANAKDHWLKNGLITAAGQAKGLNVDTIAIPRIGCGIGGMTWPQVSKTIHRVELDMDFEFTVVTLP